MADTRLRARAALAGLLVLAPAGPLRAQAAGHGPIESPDAPVAVLAAALYNDQANRREASDSAKSTIATDRLRGRLDSALAGQVVPSARVDALATSDAARRLAGGVGCNVRVACARAVAAWAGARWVVLAKVSKTSNLIWLLSAQLIHVPSGEIVLDDSTELKGEPETMIRVGVRSFADRVARTVRAGGVATDFPHGEPTF